MLQCWLPTCCMFSYFVACTCTLMRKWLHAPHCCCCYDIQIVAYALRDKLTNLFVSNCLLFTRNYSYTNRQLFEDAWVIVSKWRCFMIAWRILTSWWFCFRVSLVHVQLFIWYLFRSLRNHKWVWYFRRPIFSRLFYGQCWMKVQFII